MCNSINFSRIAEYLVAPALKKKKKRKKTANIGQFLSQRSLHMHKEKDLPPQPEPLQSKG